MPSGPGSGIAMNVTHKNALIILSATCATLLVVLFAVAAMPTDTKDGWLFSGDAAPKEPVLDTADYDRRMRLLAGLPAEVAPPVDTGATEEEGAPAPAEPPPWPVTDAPYPNVGALLPFNRIVAYYGNFYSTRMGILGEFDEATVLAKLDEEVAKWEAADPTTPVIRAIDYIAVTAQASAGKDGMYRARMPDSHVQRAIDMAAKVNGIVFLEVQPGYARIMDEVRALEKYLVLPQVHLALDPEFAMIRRGSPPGTVVGTVDAVEVNEAAEYLAGLVREHGLPPKILMVHRYTRPMVTNAHDIRPLPEVQILIDMDGWGPPEQKFASYAAYIVSEPVQFTGFKLFYKNDTKRPGSALLTPEQVLGLVPKPIFIQYQ